MVVVLAVVLWSLGRRLAAEGNAPGGRLRQAAAPRRRWTLTLVSSLVVVATSLACVLPYATAIGGLSKKKNLLQLLGVTQISAAVGLPGRMAGGVGEFVRQLTESLHPLVAAMVLLCLLCWAFRHRLARVGLPGAALPGAR